MSQARHQQQSHAGQQLDSWAVGEAPETLSAQADRHYGEMFASQQIWMELDDAQVYEKEQGELMTKCYVLQLTD